MKTQLETLKTQSEQLTAQALDLQKQHAELLPAASQTIPDLAEIQARLLAALGAGDDKARKSINSELEAAKKAADERQQAQQQLADIVASLADNHAKSVDLAAKMRPLQFETLKGEAERLAGEYMAAVTALSQLFLDVRAMAFEAEAYGDAALVPAVYRGWMQFQLPAPIMGLTADACVLSNIGKPGDPAIIAAAEAAKARAAELI